MYKLNYYYGYNAEKKEQEVLGVEYITIISARKRKIKQGFYWGVSLSLEDALLPENMKILGINNPRVLREHFEKFNAVGIIYFPTTKQHCFLEHGDIVFGTQEELLATVNALETIKEDSLDNDFYKDIDPEDPLFELYDLPQDMARRRVSSR